jgi:hypothetical protein
LAKWQVHGQKGVNLAARKHVFSLGTNCGRWKTHPQTAAKIFYLWRSFKLEKRMIEEGIFQHLNSSKTSTLQHIEAPFFQRPMSISA